MKRYTYIIGIILAGLCIDTNAQTLEEYLKIAAENNPLLKAKYAAFEASLQKVAQVNSLPDPTLSFGYFISPVETRVGPQRAKFGLSQMFPWFGTLKTVGNVFQLQAEANYQEFINARNELFMQVKSAWYPLYEINRKIILQKENLNILTTYKQLTTTGFKNSKNSMIDVIRTDILINNATTEIKLLKDQLKPLQVHFNTLFNRKDTFAIAIVDTLTLTEIATNYRKDSLLLNHPILKSFDLNYQSAQKAEELAKKQSLPKFGVGLDYMMIEKGTMNVTDNGRDAVMPMVSMSIPIYRSKYKSAVKESQFKQEAIINYKTNYENSLLSMYETNWYELEKSNELLQLYKQQIEKTNQAVILLMSAYSNSGKEFEEVLRMQQELLKYRMAEATAITTYYTALAKLDFITAKTE